VLLVCHNETATKGDIITDPRYWREFLEYLTVKSNVFTSKVNMTFSNYWGYYRELTFIINRGEEICPVEMAFGLTFIPAARKEPMC
jgi:hypothetical protein